MRKIKTLIIILIILNSKASFSQNALFEWSSGACYYEGYFDSTKNNREQINNTYKYLWWNPFIEAKVTAWKLEEIETLSVAALDKECAEKLNQLNSFLFLDSKFWDKIKQERIEEISDFWSLARITILGYKNPDTLKSYLTNDENCIFYRNALISGGQEMLNAWQKLHEIQISQNGNPERLEEKYKNQLNSAKRFEYARLELMSFGWWNSANSQIKHINMTIDFEKEFEKFFQDVKYECDEP